MAPETGPCRAKSVQYFYNPVTKRCEKFVYGGCGGNGNRFGNKGGCDFTCYPHVVDYTDTIRFLNEYYGHTPNSYQLSEAIDFLNFTSLTNMAMATF